MDSFTKDFSTGNSDYVSRWIDNISSLSSYFVSNMREVAAREKGYLTGHCC